MDKPNYPLDSLSNVNYYTWCKKQSQNNMEDMNNSIKESRLKYFQSNEADLRMILGDAEYEKTIEKLKKEPLVTYCGADSVTVPLISKTDACIIKNDNKENLSLNIYCSGKHYSIQPGQEITLPEKPKFKSGDWVYDNYFNHAYLVSDHASQYEMDIEFLNREPDRFDKLASLEEIEKTLIGEAKRRGYRHGSHIFTHLNGRSFEYDVSGTYKYIRKHDADIWYLVDGENSGITIWNSVKNAWATLLTTNPAEPECKFMVEHTVNDEQLSTMRKLSHNFKVQFVPGHEFKDILQFQKEFGELLGRHIDNKH